MAQQLLDRYPPRDYRHEMAEQAVKDCAFAMACTAQPRDMGIVSENVLNSIDKDFAPVIAPDGTALYFTSYRDETGPEAKKSACIGPFAPRRDGTVQSAWPWGRHRKT